MPATVPSTANAVALASVLNWQDWTTEADIEADTGMRHNAIVCAANVLISEGIRVLNDGDLWRISKTSWSDAKDFARGLY